MKKTLALFLLALSFVVLPSIGKAAPEAHPGATISTPQSRHETRQTTRRAAVKNGTEKTTPESKAKEAESKAEKARSKAGSGVQDMRNMNEADRL